MSSFFGSKEKEEKGVVPVDDGQAEINIFTVASGHLYEVSRDSLYPKSEVLMFCPSASHPS